MPFEREAMEALEAVDQRRKLTEPELQKHVEVSLELCDDLEGLGYNMGIFRRTLHALSAALQEVQATERKHEVMRGLTELQLILTDKNDPRFPEALDLAERISAAMLTDRGE